MKTMKRVAILIVVYVGIVAAFESMIGYFQPANQSTLVITTFDEDGHASDRVLARLESQGQIYVAANHWPRAWYEQVLENPNVEVLLDPESKEKKAYQAVPISGEEEVRVDHDHGLGLGFRLLTGFPPRYFVRLEPR